VTTRATREGAALGDAPARTVPRLSAVAIGLVVEARLSSRIPSRRQARQALSPRGCANWPDDGLAQHPRTLFAAMT
jgi:hypothetical protein